MGLQQVWTLQEQSPLKVRALAWEVRSRAPVQQAWIFVRRHVSIPADQTLALGLACRASPSSWLQQRPPLPAHLPTARYRFRSTYYFPARRSR